MDTEAQPTERDRSSRPSDTTDASQQAVEPDRPEGRSRFALVARITDLLPGGRISLTLLICLLFLLLLNAFVVKPFQIPSGSMENGLRIGDRVLVNRLAYRFGAEPRRGDVVVFDGTGYFGDADYVKRVVGVGGDHVVCCDEEGRIRVNGRPVDESTYLYPGDSPSTVPFDVEVPDGTLFVLGDHRSASSDSRDHLGSPGGGMIPVDDVIGRADWIVRSLADVTRLHRPDAYARVPAAGAGASTDAAGTRSTRSGTAVTTSGAVGTPAGAAGTGTVVAGTPTDVAGAHG
ncbi:signal peptidase I [Streptomyces sp. NPDC059894]|uniref:signal peptidase I n=1 Tax=unclassified Streptomyces TaxID=2593676 RepID=UPI00364F4C4D